ncbi:retrotransposon protein, putative, ty1-copia subclass, partial [Tanacetum coccineum]
WVALVCVIWSMCWLLIAYEPRDKHFILLSEVKLESSSSCLRFRANLESEAAKETSIAMLGGIDGAGENVDSGGSFASLEDLSPHVGGFLQQLIMFVCNALLLLLFEDQSELLSSTNMVVKRLWGIIVVDNGLGIGYKCGYLLKRRKVLVLPVLPPNGKVVKSKWIYKKKTYMDGKVYIYKARLVAKGFTQTYGVDYEETFSLVADIRAIIMDVGETYDYEIWQMDVKTVFLNGFLKEEIYMEHVGSFIS